MCTSRLAVTLRFLATGNTYKDLAYSTRIANNTLSVLIPETLEAIASVLADNATIQVIPTHWPMSKFLLSFSTYYVTNVKGNVIFSVHVILPNGK